MVLAVRSSVGRSLVFLVFLSVAIFKGAHGALLWPDPWVLIYCRIPSLIPFRGLERFIGCVLNCLPHRACHTLVAKGRILFHEHCLKSTFIRILDPPSIFFAHRLNQRHSFVGRQYFHNPNMDNVSNGALSVIYEASGFGSSASAINLFLYVIEGEFIILTSSH